MNDDTLSRGGKQGRPCIFASALLARGATCALAETLAHGESQSVACPSPAAHDNCGVFYGLLRAKSVFALKQRRTSPPIPHALVMKLECGGLLGLRQVLDIEAPEVDVRQMLAIAEERFGGLEALPFDRIVGSIAHWQGRRPAKSRSGPGAKR